MKKLICTLAALMLIWTCPKADAAYAGRLPSDQEWHVVVTNTFPSTTALTVYYLDSRGSDLVGIMTVVGTDPVGKTFPKPGRTVKRIIVEVDISPGTQCEVTINATAPMTLEETAGFRLVIDVD